MIAVLVGAFYLLLPQLANVGDSFTALRHANFGWIAICIAMSLLTYIASAVGQAGGVPNRLPVIPNVEAQAASSFVNRVTPANVGGMALNVRFMQKVGVDPPVAVTGIGLNVLGSGASLGVETATTVEEQTGKAIGLAPLLQAILDRFDAELSAPGWEREVELWERASVHHPGDRLTIRTSGGEGELTGEYRGLTPEGFLRLATAGGGETVLSSGELASW